MNAEQPDHETPDPGMGRAPALRFLVAVAMAVLLSVSGYLVLMSRENSGERREQGSDQALSPSLADPSPGSPDLTTTPTSGAPTPDPGRPTATTPNPAGTDPTANCGSPPYPKTREGWTGNPDYKNAERVVYFNGPMTDLTRLGDEVARVAGLRCVTVAMYGANQLDLSAVAWSNAGIFTKDQVNTALMVLGVTPIPTPACHPDCFK